ncbi:ROK family transcriptional regulator [Ligilactobacillus sp.]|uniref:ROK family transcriptional regulator n=1 Tax=Ligilactobacillus sp. TaxID=2767921 RepID=UPI002FE41039
MVMNKQLMRQNNVRSVLRAIISRGPISRSDISRELSLNKVTVSDILNEFLEKGYVCETGHGKSTKSGGRKPLLMEFNKYYGYFIMVEVGVDYVNIMSTYANGDISRFTELSFSAFGVENLISLIDREIPLFEAEKTSHGLLGLSFEMHEIVFENRIYTPDGREKSEDGMIFHDYFSRKYGVPVVIENEANAAAIYQRDFSSKDEFTNLISLSLHEGISAGIIIDNALYRGINGMAGNLGRVMMIEPESESYVPISELCSQAAVIRKMGLESGLSVQALQKISQLYGQCDEKAVSVLDGFTSNIAVALNNLAANFAPQIIVFNSTLLENIPSLLIKIKKKLAEIGSGDISLMISNDSKYSSLLGGYSLLIRHVFDLGTGRLCLIS